MVALRLALAKTIAKPFTTVKPGRPAMFNVDKLKRDFDDPNDLRDVLINLLKQRHLVFQEPVKIDNRGSGPAFEFVLNGREDSLILKAVNDDNQELRLGIGAASAGIMANEFMPDPNFAVPVEAIDDLFSNAEYPGLSGYERNGSGTGVPFAKAVVPIHGWAEALAGLQKSNDTEHAPDSAEKFTRNGNQYWLCREPWKWGSIRGTITAINDDTLTVTSTANGRVPAQSFTVAKPPHLRRSLFDGLTIGGIAYTYSDSQHREADDGVYTPTDEVVYDLYATSGPHSTIYFDWIVNGSGVDSVYWCDQNRGARHWIEDA